MTNGAGIKLATFAKQGGHWYDRDGNQIAEVPRAKGEVFRRPTLRDARVYQWAPGVTTILRVAAAPALEQWKIRQAVLSALTLPRQPGENDAAYLARLDADMGEQARSAAEEGTRIHAALESAYRGEECDARYLDHVAGVTALLNEALGEQYWIAEKGVAGSWGYGTKIDLHSDRWLLDFKGKDGDAEALRAMPTYADHWKQLAAGRNLLEGSQRCGIVYVSRTHPGACHLVEVKEIELRRGLGMFRHLVGHWQEDKGYRPEWAEEL